jgi:Exostosin family
VPHPAAGDGWASRLEDSLLHGTIPVIIQDNVAEKLYGLIDYAAISVRIAEADIERVGRPSACTGAKRCMFACINASRSSAPVPGCTSTTELHSLGSIPPKVVQAQCC